METPKLNEKYVWLHLQFEIVHVLFFLSSDSKLGRSGFRLLATERRTHRTPGVTSFSCTLMDHSAVLQLFKVIKRSIKVTKKTFFHPRVLYFWSFYKLEVWCLRDCRSFFSNTEVFNVCRESHSGAIKTAASDAHPCARTDDEWLFSLLVLWGLGGSFQPRQAWGRHTEVMYRYWRSHSLPVIQPIWGHEGAIKNH